MNFVLIGCKVLSRELYKLCAESPHTVEIRWIEAALHERPGGLRPVLQREIDRIEGETPLKKVDAVLLGYGLCSMSIAGLKARSIPLIVPRAHDCIAMLLGSRKRYAELFEAHGGGIYWYSPGWIEQFRVPGKQYDEQAKYADYALKYGEDNARYLIETEKSWTQRYELAAFIKWQGFDTEHFEQFTKEAAEKAALKYECIAGDEGLLKRFVDGDWNGDFCIVRPGQTLVYSMGPDILDAQ
ncbi:MAG: DUF1638 domain-containing protein [Christensenellales bacterium]|jgi:hypothetical protein